ncbi:serine/threonine-protein kinase [Sphingomonas jaspsi]|uniref:serine/threonine-protein kinase n=1 Tax=Sphingomonas jaspsi TaxID=392409 RepID=UPI0004AF079D|nr:serine/threonine-protein kinase [Sphingomonas jaspsi]
MSTSTFADVSDWKEEWAISLQLKAGGQGFGYIVSNRSNSSTAFLKVLKDQKTAERRRRFYREAASYDSLSSPGIPRLILSNAHLHEDRSVKLFIITEFVEGTNLSELENIPIPTVEAVNIVFQLLETISYLHSNGIVHRDIKPDNIVLNEREQRPTILDLGLAFKSDDDTHNTETGQELGNRFLRLPELGAGSRAKQDPASDVTFAAGVLYYLITGLYPYTLRDESGRLPHQRDDAKGFFDWDRRDDRLILGIFDRAFSYEMANRFSSSEELIDELSKLGSMIEDEDFEIEGFMSTFQSPQSMIDNDKLNAMQIAMNSISSINSQLAVKLSPRFVNQQANAGRKVGVLTNELGFAYSLDYTVSRRAKIRVEIIGIELVASFDEQYLYRSDYTSIDSAAIEMAFKKEFLKMAMQFDRELKAAGH